MTSTSIPTYPTRLASLDAFRGMTIAAMILVNTPGSWDHVYPPLRHAAWHGWTPTDLIFPFFLFIVGVSLSFSILGARERGVSDQILVRKVFGRSLIIICIGLFLNAFPSFDVAHWRVPGVLQRIGVAFCICALLTLKLRARALLRTTVGILLFYWGLMTLVPTPQGPPNLTPEGNLGAHLDRAVFGEAHLWRGTWDPEGLLSTLPAVATTLTGTLTGLFLRSGSPNAVTASWMFVSGWLAIVLGALWDVAFPINKQLWTSSYVVFSSGAALQLFAVCYFLIDVRRLRAWARPAVIFGMNPIIVYAGSQMLTAALSVPLETASGNHSLYTWLYDTWFRSWAGALNGSLFFAFAAVLLWFGVASVMFRRRVFVKV